MIRLNAHEFASVPSPSQVANLCDEIHSVINKLMGLIMAEGEGTANDPKIGLALNGAGQIKQAGDHFRGSSGIAQPQLVPRPAVMQGPQI